MDREWQARIVSMDARIQELELNSDSVSFASPRRPTPIVGESPDSFMYSACQTYSIEKDATTAELRLYDFRQAVGNRSLTYSQFGTGSDQYLALVRHNDAADGLPKLEYADLSTALGPDNDKYVRVTNADTTSKYLYSDDAGVQNAGKLTVADPLQISVLNAGGDEQMQIKLPDGGEGHLIYYTGSSWTTTNLQTLGDGLWWKLGTTDPANSFGTYIGDKDKNTVVYMDRRGLEHGDWAVYSGNFNVVDTSKAFQHGSISGATQTDSPLVINDKSGSPHEYYLRGGILCAS